MLENVYYINLESRTDRKELVEKELNTLGWKYQRFNAIKMKNGRIGCSMSHLKLLQMAKEQNLDYIVIVEDDIEFKKPDKYNKMLKKFLSNYDKSDKSDIFDVLLLAGNLRNPVLKVNDYTLKVFKSWTTTGYIVKNHYFDTLINNIKEGIHYLLKNPDLHHLYAIDAYWMRLQEKDNWYILYPRTITQRPMYSDIEQREINYDRLMLDV